MQHTEVSVLDLQDAANVITGSADSIETVSLNSGDDINILCDEIYNKINLVNKGNGVVIFVDLTSASPYNQSMMAIQKLDKELQKSTFIVSGVNLPMVLEAINSQFWNAMLIHQLEILKNKQISQLQFGIFLHCNQMKKRMMIFNA